MKRNEAQAIIDALVKVRETITDEQALEVPAMYPAWRSGVAYVTGNRVLHNSVLYKVLQDHTSQEDWMPDVSPSLFAEVLIPDASVIPAWTQPDSTNTYAKGDKVTHDGCVWVSEYDNNSWEPGVYGWIEVI